MRTLRVASAHRTHELRPARLTASNRLGRAAWKLCWIVLYRPSPILLHAWRRWLLRVFGARIGAGAHPYPGARIWAPWNLTMKEHSCLANHVDCYCVAPVTLGRHSTVSQYSYLCAASHDTRDPALPLVTAPITIEDEVWIGADVFVGPGVVIHEGAVVGARSTVLDDVDAWSITAGYPARKKGERPRPSRAQTGREHVQADDA